ncbi:hypothetical protein HYE82_18805 [Streptomyces sp. BR123]|uniref:hypothetical protein n=1 Tax=Streptomyces sp. BR123 TaxID=2749828 RepID=UPI0015C48D46|nr:hypothetical protein [Streptomyces sp. BR123]NXY96403.1 hypothetical protein [Streptomyces sp. BR123]
MISPTTARHVLHHFGRAGGTEPGTFTASLIAAIAAADHTNFARLATLYPELATAIEVAKHDRDGITKLQMISVGREAA